MRKVLLTPGAAEDLQVLPEPVLAAIVSFLDYLNPDAMGGAPQIGIPRQTRPHGPAKLGGYGAEFRVEKNNILIDRAGRYDAQKKVIYSARSTTAAGKIWLDKPFKPDEQLPRAKTLEDQPPAMPKALTGGLRPAIEYGRALLASRLMRRRQTVGLLQRELAARAGIPPETLHRIERAKLTARPTTVERVVRALEEAEAEFRKQGTLRGGMLERANFAIELVRLRKAAGLTENELAKRAGLVPLTIQMLEKGDRVPHIGTVRRLMRVFKKEGVASSTLAYQAASRA
jgi:predicted transcriptional regulator